VSVPASFNGRVELISVNVEVRDEYNIYAKAILWFASTLALFLLVDQEQSHDPAIRG
jgi:hypothetical protein